MEPGFSRPVLEENVVENPLTGERVVFSKDPPRRDVLLFDLFVAPKGGLKEAHLHSTQVETLRCVRGAMHVVIGGHERVLNAGDVVPIPAGVAHSFSNPFDSECVCHVEVEPAGKTEPWLKLCHASSRLYGTLPGVLDLAPFLLDVNIYIGGLPIWFQRAVFHLLRPLSRILGRKKKMLDIASEVYGRRFTW